MRKIHHILFDLDGTLVDSSDAIQAALNHALEPFGLQFPAERTIGSVIGTPLLDIFRDEFGIVAAPAEQAIARYREYYDAHALAGTRVYERVVETLERLSAAGFNLFVATVKPSPIAAKVLRDMDLAKYFRGVAGSSMDHAVRDKGTIIRHALQAHDLESAHGMMVGDRAQDIEGARQNGLYAVGVTWGFGSLQELAAAGADRLVDSSSEIPTLLTVPARYA